MSTIKSLFQPGTTINHICLIVAEPVKYPFHAICMCLSTNSVLFPSFVRVRLKAIYSISTDDVHLCCFVLVLIDLKEGCLLSQDLVRTVERAAAI